MNANPLRRYRQEHQLTLDTVADWFRVNKSTVLRWEERQIPAERVLEIERMTGIPRSKLRPDIYPERELA